MENKHLVKSATRFISSRPLLFNVTTGELTEQDGAELKTGALLVDSRAVPNKNATPPPIVHDKLPDVHGFTVSGTLITFPLKVIWGWLKWITKKKS